MCLFQKRLQLVLQPHPIAPQLVLLARYRPPQTLRDTGHKAQSYSRPTSRFTRGSASTKSLLRPRRPRLDSACARCNVPDLRLAPSRFSRIGFQYLSSASHTGFQYCAVDSMTTSSASCSTNHAASDRSCSGLLPNIRRSNWYSPTTSTSDTTT